MKKRSHKKEMKRVIQFYKRPPKTYEDVDSFLSNLTALSYQELLSVNLFFVPLRFYPRIIKKIKEVKK